MSFKSFVIQIFVFIFILKSVNGGQCLSNAQRLCIEESTKLVEAQRARSGVCSAFATYNACIRNALNKVRCQLTQEEATLHENDIEKEYTGQKYSCRNTDKGWVSYLRARTSSSVTGIHGNNLIQMTVSICILCAFRNIFT